MTGWQLQTLAALRQALPSAPVGVHGSCTTPEDLDGWSDLDAEVSLDTQHRLVDVLDLLDGGVWALQESRDEDGQLLRIILVDGRRIDLRVHGTPMLAPPLPDDNDVRFDSALAAARFGRGSALIGLHLTMEILRKALVLQMIAADRAQGTTHHRHATPYDASADLAREILTPPLGPTTALTAYDLYGQWRREVEPDHRPDATGLVAVIERGSVTPPDAWSR